MAGIGGLRVLKNLIKTIIFLYNMGIPFVLFNMLYNKLAYSLKDFFTFRIEAVIVRVEQGELKGRKAKSVLGKPYYKFQGIPYAKAPLGPLRFRDPQPPEPWIGVRSALKEGSIASQSDAFTGFSRGSEDCLFLNIFTPELPSERTPDPGKPVLVWIHGGGFHLGSGNAEIYGPDFFLEEDVVLVTLNYRLGVFGFLSTGTAEVPGNAGLKDIIQALKWIQRNISVFGGNQNLVTIFGESAGGAAVHYLMMTPLAKGLFQRAISQSGCSLCPWAISEDPVGTAFRLGRAFGIDTTNPHHLVDYLREIPHSVLATKQTVALSQQYKRECIPFPFLPCVEPPSSENPFLTEKPTDILKSEILHSDVPYMIGVNKMEGMIMLKRKLLKINHRTIVDRLPPPRELDKDFERVVPRSLNLRYGSEESKIVAKKIREFYFSSKAFTKKTYREYVNLMTDTFFVMPMMEMTKLQSRFMTSPIYHYQFMYDGDMGLLKKMLNVKDIPGPVHADEVGYLFHVPLLGPNLDQSSQDMLIRKKMVRLWVNFAKYGNPTPYRDPALDNILWIPYEENNRRYLNIDETLSVAKNMNQHRLQFWRDIKEKILFEDRLSC